MKPITWKSLEWLTSKIKPTPNNFKLKTEDGLSRFKHSTKTFGRAGTIILNLDGTIIDGNTRWEEAKEKGETKVWVSIPSRQLTPKEFKEFSAMYDAARAGEVDMLRIKKELGNTKSFFKQWGLEELPGVMENLAELEKVDGKVIATSQSTKQSPVKESDTKPLTLLFTTKENNTFIAKAESLYKKYKVDNVTDLVFKVLMQTK